VYYHFKSKAELVEALIAQQPLAARVRAAAATGGTPTEQIVASLTAVVDFIRDNHDFARLLITEMWREDRVWRESLMMLRNGSINVIRDVILDGVSSGEFAPTHDPDIAAGAVFYMAATTALDWLMLDPDRPGDQISDEVTRLALGALRG
jgi:AcrR family transcriptional regulator